jgi:tetratricopeptide (TPR) repeat protein
MEGRFDAAAALGETILVAAAAENSWVAHAAPTQLLAQVDLESGRDVDARTLADRYVKEHEAWLPPHRVDDLAISEDPFPSMLAILRRAGAITPAEHEKQRQAWIDAWNGKVGDAYARFVWVWGYAAAVTTDEEGREAVAALAKAPPLPPFTPQTPADAVLGRTFLRAGDVDRAVPYLERGAHACLSFDASIEQVHAYADLGEARARKGETDKACAAYRVVLDRWGAATPKSITVEAARKAFSALKCPTK